MSFVKTMQNSIDHNSSMSMDPRDEYLERLPVYDARTAKSYLNASTDNITLKCHPSRVDTKETVTFVNGLPSALLLDSPMPIVSFNLDGKMNNIDPATGNKLALHDIFEAGKRAVVVLALKPDQDPKQKLLVDKFTQLDEFFQAQAWANFDKMFPSKAGIDKPETFEDFVEQWDYKSPLHHGSDDRIFLKLHLKTQKQYGLTRLAKYTDEGIIGEICDPGQVLRAGLTIKPKIKIQMLWTKDFMYGPKYVMTSALIVDDDGSGPNFNDDEDDITAWNTEGESVGGTTLKKVAAPVKKSKKKRTASIDSTDEEGEVPEKKSKKKWKLDSTVEEEVAEMKKSKKVKTAST